MTIKMVQIPVVRKTPVEAAILDNHKGRAQAKADRFKQVQDQELDALDRYLAQGCTVVGNPTIIADNMAEYLVYILWASGPPAPHSR